MAARIVLVIFLLIFIYMARAFANPIPARRVDADFRPQYGVSWSFEQAAWYGLDPRESYIKLLDGVEPDWVRLPFFWNLMTDTDGNLKIDDLKFAIEEAARREIKVIIALGAKTPYYPEYHLPEYVRSQLKFADTLTLSHPIADDILKVDKKVVEALYRYGNIAYWQIENEPYLASVNNWKIATDLLAEEVKVVKNADPQKRPIILNHVGPATFDKRHRQLLDLLSGGDVLGVNAYFKTQGIDLLAFKVLGKEVHIKWPKWFVFPVQSWWGFSPNYQSLATEVQTKGIGFWILEMQAEPYIRNLDDASASDFSYLASDIIKADQFIRSYGIKSIGLWGANFWQYRQSIDDSSWMEAVKQVTRD